MLPGTVGYCGMGLRTAAGADARRFYACRVDVRDSLDDVLLDVLHDAQTSGGLLVAVRN